MNVRGTADTGTRALRVIAGEWRIARRLGRGGTANVYLAVHIHDGRKAALKILRRELVGQKLLERRFLREAELTAKVRHPNVLEIYGHGTVQDGRPYIVAELLEGETMDEMRLSTRDKKLSWQDVVDMGISVLDALEAAHTAGVVHRDVKPTNIFVTKDRVVKLLDFGIAGLGEDASVLKNENTRTALGIGTPLFMAPEQLTGDDAIDGRADLFGVAATLFHAMSGRVPFGTSSFSVGALIAAYVGGPADLRELVPDCPRQVVRVVNRALAMRPHERFASAADMRSALESAREQALAPARPAGKSPAWIDQTKPLPTVRRMQVAAQLGHPQSWAAGTPPKGEQTPMMGIRPQGIPSTPPGALTGPNVSLARPASIPPPAAMAPSPRSMPSAPPPASPRGSFPSADDLGVVSRPRPTSVRPHPGPPPESMRPMAPSMAPPASRSSLLLVALIGVLLILVAFVARRYGFVR